MEKSEALVQWRDHEKLAWKEIAKRYKDYFEEEVRVPTLQMRYGRAKDRAPDWTSDDVTALLRAHQFWLDTRYITIMGKVRLDGGSRILDECVKGKACIPTTGCRPT